MIAPDPSKLSDAELSALVAEKVAGYSKQIGASNWWSHKDTPNIFGAVPSYATSADAVLPLLENKVEWSCYATKGRFEIHVTIRDIANITTCDVAPTFPRAACLALLAAANREGNGET